MGIKKAMAIGTVFGFIVAVVFSLIFMLIGQGLAGGFTSFWGESWFYYATIVPIVITFMVLSIYLLKKEVLTNKKLWIISFISALFITWYSATIGAITGEYIVRGLIQNRETLGINEKDTLIWGTLYALILTPLTTPITRVIIGLFYNILKKFNAV